MILQQVKQKSLKVKTNRKKNSRNQQSRRKSRKIKSKSNMKKKSKKSKSRQKNDRNPDLNIENYSTQLRKCLQNDLDCKDIYKILNDVCIYYKILTTPDQRSFFFNTISWSIPTKQNINDIIKFIRSNECPYILEIGSGLGLWASILKKNDIKVHATDDHSWSKDKFYTNEIENINHVDAIKKYNDENACLFLCWPPQDNDLSKYCLQNFNGKYLIYIGQKRGGKNANSEFFSMLKGKNNCCELVNEITEEFSDDLEEKYKETHFFNDLTGIHNDNIYYDNIYFYRITEIGKFILGMLKRENLDDMELIIFNKQSGKKLENKITYTNSEYKFELVLTKQRLRITNKITNLFIIAYFPSDACAYKFKDEEITEL